MRRRKYSPRILRVNLSKRKFSKGKISPSFVGKYIGGRGFGARILYDEIKADVAPLSTDNKLIFATGPLAGTTIPGSSRTALVSKSPLTGGYGDSDVGGNFGPELRSAGYDCVILEKRAKNPQYLVLDDDTHELREASHIWGETTRETQNIIKEELGDDTFNVAAIGPAGERLVKFAIIDADDRQAGRCGLGAVMGSKNLKAVAIRGTGDIPIVDADAFHKTAEECHAILKNSWEKFTGALELKQWRRYGTAHGVLLYNEWGCLPTRNYQSGFFEKAETISGELMREKLVVAEKGCYGCPTGCTKFSVVKTGPYAGTFVDGIEYETLGTLGSNCGIANIEAVAKANQLCDQLGLDTCSTGNVIGFAMECYEKGILKKKDTDGLDLRFGREDAYLQVIEMIAKKEGIGKILAEGVRFAAQKFGSGSGKFAIHSKGMEFTAYEVRGMPGMALAYATCDIGAHHKRANPSSIEVKDRGVEGKAKLVVDQQHDRSLADLIGVCRIVKTGAHIGLEKYAEAVSAATGVQFDKNDLLEAAERVYNLTRAFNARLGFSRKDDVIPDRFFEEPVPSGPTKGMRIHRSDFERMLNEYYEIRGWDTKTGIPTRRKLEDLGLKDIADDLEQIA